MVRNLNNSIKSIIITIIALIIIFFILVPINREMGDLLSITWIVLISLLFAMIFGFVGYIVFTYNTLVSAKNYVANSWAQIDVQLKKRMDLIPNIVDTVKGYAKHENEIFINVTNARASLQSATTIRDTADANNMLTNTLKSMFAVVENYPDLKANANFLDLQKQLSSIEQEIANQRTVFNKFVLRYNNLCEQFPSNMIASRYNFKVIDYFHTDDESRNVPKVKF